MHLRPPRRLSTPWFRTFRGMTLLLLPILLFLGACAVKTYPDPGEFYQNQQMGYEFSYTETGEQVQIKMRNTGKKVLDVETIGFYTIEDGGINAIKTLDIEDGSLEPRATTTITFPMEGEGFIIMNSAGSFVVGDMFEVRY